MLEVTVKIRIPTDIRELIGDIPNNEATPEVVNDVLAAVAQEMVLCLQSATFAKGQAQIFFNPMRQAGTQRIIEFGVNDLGRPKEERYNFHGQNVSQWLYAGGILLEGGKVSRHH